MEPAGGTGSDEVAAGGGDDRVVHDLVDLYRRYERRIFRMCVGQLRNTSDAEDAVQETFSRAAPLLDRLQGDPSGYLLTIARNVCRDEMRRRARCVSTNDPAVFGELEVGHPETSSIDRDQINAAWTRLSARERDFIGRRFAGFSYEEIAGHLHMTTGALNVALARARKRARHYASAASGVLALLSLRRLAGRPVRSSAASAAMPSALATAAAVTCVVIGVAGGNWFASQQGRAAVAGPTLLRGAAGAGVPNPAIPVIATSADAQGAGRTPAAGRAASPSGGAGRVTDLAGSVISPGSNATQQDVVFTSLTPSPAYRDDHTVLASGTLANGCGRPTCPVVFETRDGGATWQHLGAAGFLGGKILLSPAYPSDPVMFAAGPAGLQRSDNGGASFQTVVPSPAPAAVDPRSQPGAARVFLAAQVPVIYDAATRRVEPGPALPAGVTPPTDVTYASGGGVVMVSDQIDPLAATHQDGVVIACPDEGACRVTFADARQPVLNLAVPVESRGVVIAWSWGAVDVSGDGGATFHPLALPTGAGIHTVSAAVDFMANPKILVASAGAGGDRLFQSANGGTSFATVTASGLEQDVAAAMLVLPDGHEIAAVDTPPSVTGFGIRCSADGGAHWAMSC